MAEIKFKQIEIPKENLTQNKTNKKWQEIRRASNIVASLVLNMKNEIVPGEITSNNKLEELYLYSDSIALIVNMSLSVELAFKAILEYQGNFKFGHKLDELFSRLNERTKKLIIRYLNINRYCWNEKYNDEQEFVDALKPINELYVKYRYFFDEKYDLKHFNKDLTLLFRLFDFLIRYINYKLK